jgi:putative ABC transport system permease protein
MIKNYFKIAWRNHLKNKVSSFVNLISLTLGVASSVLIALYVSNDLSYDSYHEYSNRIGLFQQYENSSSSGSAFKPLLEKRSGIEQVCHVSPQKALVSKSDFAAFENRFCLVDSNLQRLFQFRMVSGSIKEALESPNKLVISEKIAKKYFGNENPLGKSLNVQLKNKNIFEVVGVMSDFPENTHLKIDLIASNKNKEQLMGSRYESFWDLDVLTYFLLKENSSFEQIRAQLPDILNETNDQNKQVWKLSIIPLEDIYLKNRTDDRIVAKNAIEFVTIFLIVGFAIIILACFNYLNLSLAISNLRLKEIGVRKVIGAHPKHLIGQFMGETFIFTLFSSILALVLVYLTVPFFNQIAEKNLNLIDFISYKFFLVFFGFVMLISLASGIYPAFIMSSSKPSNLLKKSTKIIGSLSNFRKSLVTIQFTVSMVMIFATLVVYFQLDYVQNKNLGYNRDQVISLILPEDFEREKRKTIEDEFKKLKNIKSISNVSILPGNGISFNKVAPVSITSQKIEPKIGQIFTDPGFTSVFDIKLAEGRFFKENNLSDLTAFVINRKAANTFSWQLGQSIAYTSYQYNSEGGYSEVHVFGQIIGIVEDYHQMDLKSEIVPILIANGSISGTLALKLETKDIKNSISDIEEVWDKFIPNYPFEYQFLDETFASTYNKEARILTTLGLFALLSLIISALGLFGLVTFSVQHRIREISIRKVLGSSSGQIVRLLSKDFIYLLFLATLIACPISFFIMNKWLQDFSFHIELSWWIYCISILVTFIVAVSTISIKSYNASLMNPVKSLNSE